MVKVKKTLLFFGSVDWAGIYRLFVFQVVSVDAHPVKIGVHLCYFTGKSGFQRDQTVREHRPIRRADDRIVIAVNGTFQPGIAPCVDR
jgi:hypothetical protein